MQHVTSFTMFDSYHVGWFTTQTRDFEKIQDCPHVKRCILLSVKNKGESTFVVVSLFI